MTEEARAKWTCVVTIDAPHRNLPIGFDLPMRSAVERALEAWGAKIILFRSFWSCDDCRTDPRDVQNVDKVKVHLESPVKEHVP